MALAAIFNRESRRDWLDQKFRGRHDARLADILARVEKMPDGAEVLKRARDMGVKISVVRKGALGHATQGQFSPRAGGLEVSIANSGKPAKMAIALWHELRHVLQYGAAKGMAYGGKLRDARASHLMAVMTEADAFTAETVAAAQQRRAGDDSYYNALLNDRSEGPHRFISSFLRRRPPESFSGDAAFARALFTALMTDGLIAYRAPFFGDLRHKFLAAGNAETLQKIAGREGDIETPFSPQLAAMYGPEFMSATSMRALQSAFWRVQPLDERMTLALIERTVGNAGKMTGEQFRAARDEILQRTQELYFKDDREFQFYSPSQEKLRKKMKAAAESPSPR